MESGNWRGEGWPGPEAHARRRLPRAEDLPAAENGYDREKVREAFDAFYRHIAQLDSTLRALEAVEVFRDQAGELRKELRALKAAGWTQQPWPSHTPVRVSPGLPESLPRFALEAVFLIAVAVVVAVAGFDRLSIVLVMALAWAIVGVVEWAASRERFARKAAPVPVRSRVEAEPPAGLRVVSAEPAGAAAWEEPHPVAHAEAEAEEDERTVVRTGEESSAPAIAEEAEQPVAEPGPEPVAVEPGEVADPGPAGADQPAAVAAEPEAPAADGQSELEPEPEDLDLEPEPEPEPEPSPWSWATDSAVERARESEGSDEERGPKRRFWQRRKREPDAYRFEPTQPRHVRVLPPAPSFEEQFALEPANQLDPWEEELDLSIEEPEGTVEPEREPQPR